LDARLARVPVAVALWQNKLKLKKILLNEAIIIFVRHPELGKVKTRLAATIGNENALKVYQFLLKHTYSLIKDLPLHVYVYYAGEIIKDDLWDGNNINKKQQTGNDLGEKMRNAFNEVFSIGYTKVVIIGSDCYELTEGIINQSFDEMDNAETVIGPAKDGGYYLLGMKEPIKNIFENIEWSTDTVFKKTMKKISEKKITVSILDELNDVDTEDDITFPY
jgi:rSAM/selenodomain-associated transferase 1